MRKFEVLLLSLTLVGAPTARVAAQAPVPDTTRRAPPFFTYRDALLLGAFGAATLAMDPLDRHFATRLQDPSTQGNHFLHRTSTFFRLMGQPGPQIIAVGLYGVGRWTKNEKIEKLAVHGTEAMLLSTAATTTIKVLAGRARPRLDTTKALGFKFGRGFPGFLGGKGTEYQSFPSGHATTAFAVASAATAEWTHWVDQWHDPEYYKYLVGGVLYGGAALVGISRMYNNAHWASDVMAGAAIGTFAGIKTVRYNYRHPNNKVERWLVKVNVIPGNAQAPTYVGFSLTPSTVPAPPAPVK